MTVSNPIAISPTTPYLPYSRPDCAVYSDGNDLYVKFTQYVKVVVEHTNAADEHTDSLRQHNEQLQSHSHNFSDLMTSVNRTWSRRVNLSEKEKIITMIVLSVLAILVIALAAALAITLIALL